MNEFKDRLRGRVVVVRDREHFGNVALGWDIDQFRRNTSMLERSMENTGLKWQGRIIPLTVSHQERRRGGLHVMERRRGQLREWFAAKNPGLAVAIVYVVNTAQ